MGFQDALYMLDICFDSEKCVEFADYSMEVISYHAILTSSKLAEERGSYQTFRGSKWDRGIFPIDTLDLLEEERGEKIEVSRAKKLDWDPVYESVRKHGMRNSNCLAMAPTATISNIAGSFPTIEPIFKNLYVKSNMSGAFTVVNNYLVQELKKNKLWNEDLLDEIKRHDGSIDNIASISQEIKNKYKEAFDIEPEWFARVAAYRGKWIDQSQSLNLFIKGTSGKKISDVYMLVWKLGLKTTYYLRSIGATGVEKSTLDLKKQTKQESVPQAQTEQEAVAVPVRLSEPVREPERAEVMLESKKEEKAIVHSPPVKSKIRDIIAQPMLCRIGDPECEACQ